MNFVVDFLCPVMMFMRKKEELAPINAANLFLQTHASPQEKSEDLLLSNLPLPR